MAHTHSHTHVHIDSLTSATRLFLTMLLNLLITVVQIAGGILSGSLSLISDALHNLSDAAAIIISYIAIKLSARQYRTLYLRLKTGGNSGCDFEFGRIDRRRLVSVQSGL